MYLQCSIRKYNVFILKIKICTIAFNAQTKSHTTETSFQIMVIREICNLVICINISEKNLSLKPVGWMGQ